MKRREFIGTVAAALTPLPAWSMHGAKSGKRDRLACNSWPFRAYFDTPQLATYRDRQYPLLTQADFPQFLADHFQIHNVEFLPQHFLDTEPGTIDKVKAGLKKAKSSCCNLMGVEFSGGLFSNSVSLESLKKEAERWVGVATALGSPSITVALNGHGPADASVAAHNLAPVVEAANSRGVKILFHNDDIKTETAEILTSIISKLGNKGAGTCPDFGNFATRSAAYALSQLRTLAPYASNICHAKDGIAADGKFHADDFPASMKVMHEAGFRGLYSLEFEGLGAPLDGLSKLLKLTEEYMI